MASPQPRVGVVTYPGSQDDRDALWALAALDAEAVPVWHEEHELPDLDAVVLPGGFSYGDYLRCGAIARFSPATAAVCEFAERGRARARHLQRLPDPLRGRPAAGRAAPERDRCASSAATSRSSSSATTCRSRRAAPSGSGS